MSAKDRFEDTIQRCYGLIELYSNTPNDDLMRAAIVLAVSAFDMYVADRFAEHFICYIKNHRPTQNDVKFLEKIGFTLKDALEMLQDTPERPYRRIRTLLDEHLSHTAMQSFKKINNQFNYYGLNMVLEQAEHAAKRKTLLKSVQIMIKRRHDIAHSCDYNGKYRLQAITLKETKKRINDLVLLVSHMNTLITSHYADQSCAEVK